jgi:hypothetical protein
VENVGWPILSGCDITPPSSLSGEFDHDPSAARAAPQAAA